MRVMIAMTIVLAFASQSMAQQNFREQQASVERKFLIGPLPQTRQSGRTNSIELLTQLTESLAPAPDYVFGLGSHLGQPLAPTTTPELPDFVNRWLDIPKSDSQDWILDKATPLQELTHPITARRPS